MSMRAMRRFSVVCGGHCVTSSALDPPISWPCILSGKTKVSKSLATVGHGLPLFRCNMGSMLAGSDVRPSEVRQQRQQSLVHSQRYTTNPSAQPNDCRPRILP